MATLLTAPRAAAGLLPSPDHLHVMYRYLARHALARSMHDREVLGPVLEACRGHYGFDEEGLALYLGCGIDQIPRLAWLCRPDPRSPAFQAQAGRIAAITGADPGQLMRLLEDERYG